MLSYPSGFDVFYNFIETKSNPAALFNHQLTNTFLPGSMLEYVAER